MEEIGAEEEIEAKGMALSAAKWPYHCAMYGKWNSLEQFYKDHPMELVGQLTTNNDTALHVVASAGHNGLLHSFILLVNERTSWMSGHAFKMENNHGNTPLHEVAVSGNLEAAKHLVDAAIKFKRESDPSYEGILEIRNHLGETPLYKAAALGRTKLVKYLVSKVRQEDVDSHFKRKIDEISILHIAIIGQHFETALWLLEKYPHLAKRKESNGLTSLQLLANMPSAFDANFRKSIWKKFIYECVFLSSDTNDWVPTNQNDDLESGINQPCQSGYSKTISKLLGWRRIRRMFREMQNQKSLLQLTDFLVKKDYSWAESDSTQVMKTFSMVFSNNPPEVKADADISGRCDGETSKSTYKNTPLLIATGNGILQIVEKTLLSHPQAVEVHDIKTRQNILHIAIKYRQLDIFNMVKRKRWITSRLAHMIDSDGNTILHHAADVRYSDTRSVSGPAFQLQEELRWMARVRKIVPSHYAMHQNDQGLTAQKLFEKGHAKLLKSAKTWIKETAQSCSTVAALVATVAYAAAFTAPGGNDNSGVPVLRHSPFFVTFAVSDTVSLICSLTSLGTFLSILTSPFEYENFHHSLPFRLHLGFALLFFSLVATMVTFTATIVLLIHHQKTWTTSLIYVVALLPVSVFGLSQFPLSDGFSQGLIYISKTMRPMISFIRIVFFVIRYYIRRVLAFIHDYILCG